MVLDIERVHVLYAVGVLLGVITTFFFAFVLLDDLSPTITVLLLGLGFILFGSAGLYSRVNQLGLVFYSLSAAAYLAALWYGISTFEFGDIAVFVALALSSALFVGLGYLSTEGYLDVEQRWAGIAMVAVLGVGILLVGVDIAGAQTTSEIEFEDEIEIPELRDDTRLGTATVHNEFILSRTADHPEVHACLYTPDRADVPIRFDNRFRGSVLAGGESVSSDLSVHSRGFYDENETLHDALQDRETIPVEQRETCPETVDEVKLVVSQDSPNSPHPPRP